MSRRLPILSLILVAVAVTACSWFEDPTPEYLRFQLSGPSGATVDVVYSTQFVAGVDEQGVTHVSLYWADTLRRSLPIDTTVYIGIDRRFFVEVKPIQPDPAAVDVRVDVDNRPQIAEGGTIQSSKPWRYAYLFNQRITRIIDTVL